MFVCLYVCLSNRLQRSKSISEAVDIKTFLFFKKKI